MTVKCVSFYPLSKHPDEGFSSFHSSVVKTITPEGQFFSFRFFNQFEKSDYICCMGRKENFVICEIEGDRMPFKPLLLIGDESESMLDRYVNDGNLYAGFIGNEPVAVCACLPVNDLTVEVKNLAVLQAFRRRGYGRMMLRHIENRHPGKTIILGTGETPSTLRFYHSCGYRYSHRVTDFFTDNYPAPIVEEGVTLRDMIYLKKAPL